MSTNFEKLKKLLAELFQFDQADLDFGIYRIMNQKRDEITQFLEKDLLPQVKEAFKQYQPAEKSVIQKELENVIAGIIAAGMNPDDSPKVKELRRKLADSVDLTAIEEEIFSQLHNFFRRYYEKGDFISMRRYKEGVYYIPYEGEEVKLYWANHDQYYIKTTEYFKDYVFVASSSKHVHLKILQGDTEKDNQKALNGNERRFFLTANKHPEVNGEDLYIYFDYIPDPGKRPQGEINKEITTSIFGDDELKEWKCLLAKPCPTEANPNRTLLEKHLTDYTSRNTFDYFIHKDLNTFLLRELDFFIKNEVIYLDDIDQNSLPNSIQYLGKARILRLIAHKIIALLAQVENFQKKLWLKKKFIVETNYCLTLDRIPKSLYAEISGGDLQREEWVRLLGIDQIDGYSVPLSTDFLEANPYMSVDTRNFDEAFKVRLIASLENVDDQCDGLLVHSENFQALNFLQSRYNQLIKAIYIDPPYNTSASEIIYKNNYKHSSWLSLANDRIKAGKYLLKDEGIQCLTIDDAEFSRVHQLLISLFGEENHLATVPIRSKPQGRAMPSGFSPNHEYAIFFGNSSSSEVGRLPRDERRLARYAESDEDGIYTWANFRGTGANSRRVDRLKLYYPIYINGETGLRIPDLEWSDPNQRWETKEAPEDTEVVVFPIDDENTERVWTLGWDRAQREASQLLNARFVGGRWQVYRKYRPNQDGALPGTWWDDPKYSASESGTKVLQHILGTTKEFSYPKSVFAVQDCIRAMDVNGNDIVVDFFAGSGTTAHAIINLNREDGGKRKYVLVEMGEYINSVVIPRIKKVIYSSDWKDGRPTTVNGIGHFFKYIRLESYEDTLNNLKVKRTQAQQMLLGASSEFRENYMLSYFLDAETKGSNSLLNIDAIEDPLGYKLNISTGSVGETKITAVNMVETFNYLLGLNVKHLDQIQGFLIVQGLNPIGEKVLVIWRNLKEKTNEELEAFFRKQDYNLKDMEFDLIYVNGDNNLENLRRADETWKVRLIEEEFQRLMFETEEL